QILLAPVSISDTTTKKSHFTRKYCLMGFNSRKAGYSCLSCGFTSGTVRECRATAASGGRPHAGVARHRGRASFHVHKLAGERKPEAVHGGVKEAARRIRVSDAPPQRRVGGGGGARPPEGKEKEPLTAAKLTPINRWGEQDGRLASDPNRPRLSHHHR